MRNLSVFFLTVLLTLSLQGQTSADTAGTTSAPATSPSLVERMRTSVERQRVAARRQAGGASLSDSFFTSAWLSPKIDPIALQPAAALSAGCSALAKDDLDPFVLESAQTAGLEANLIRAVITRESAGRPCAVSEKGAQGLMQLMPDTQTEFSVKNAFDPAENVLAGSRYLKQLIGRYNGNMELALAAYNAGPGRVTDSIPEIAETQQYVSAVLSRYRELQVQ